MITTDKNIPCHSIVCDCGRTIKVASNQPPGDEVHVICECFQRWSIQLTGKNNHKGLYKARTETQKLRNGITEIFRRIGRPMTVRQVFYQAVYFGLVPKNEKGYGVIQRNILEMRRYGHLPYNFVSDLTRRMVKPNSYNGLGDALDRWMNFYRQDVWADQPAHVEIWLEKDALAGIFADITTKYDVPLFIARGFSSESFLYSASQEIKRINKPTYVYYFSDFDQAGLNMCKQVSDKLPRFGVNIEFIRAGLTESQVKEYNLPSRPSKGDSDTFKNGSTELDAMNPIDLQGLIEGCILKHISIKDLENIMMEETVQKNTLMQLANNFGLA